MTVHCAECGGFICRGGLRDAGPDDCPMRGDLPGFQELYPEHAQREFLVQASRVEAEGYCRWTRIEELVQLAGRMGYRRVGVAHCRDMEVVASRVGGFLESRGLKVVLPPPPSASSCDPLAQAELFHERGTDLNVLGGLCVGHESMFVAASPAPVVGLVARDVRLRHNPVAALYTSRSYLKDELHGHWPLDGRPPLRGLDIETLSRVAQEMRKRETAPRSRLAETMEFAHGLGARRLGVSFCVGFREEALILSRILEANGFQVSSVCCKTGAVPKEEAGIQDAEKVRPGRKEMICNPSAQAELLNREGVEMALILGQCVGHDAATLHRLQVPSTYLVAKDRVLAHNTVAAMSFLSP